MSRALLLLSEMEDSTIVSPDLLSYSGVVSCIAKSKRGDATKKAEGVLNRMTVPPDNGEEYCTDGFVIIGGSNNPLNII